MSKRFLLSLSKRFILSWLTFRSLIHFKFTFVYGFRQWSMFPPILQQSPWPLQLWPWPPAAGPVCQCSAALPYHHLHPGCQQVPLAVEVLWSVWLRPTVAPPLGHSDLGHDGVRQLVSRTLSGEGWIQTPWVQLARAHSRLATWPGHLRTRLRLQVRFGMGSVRSARRYFKCWPSLCFGSCMLWWRFRCYHRSYS